MMKKYIYKRFFYLKICSLGPLLIKDELMVPYFALNIFYLVAFFNVYGDVQLYNCLSFGGKNVTFTVSHYHNA